MDETINQNTNQTIQQNTNSNPSRNKLLDYVKKNKYIVFAFSMLLVLLLVGSSLIFLVNQNNTPETNTTVPTASPTETVAPTDSSTNNQLPKSNNPQEAAIIVPEVKPQLDKTIHIDYQMSYVKEYDPAWAMVEVSNPETDPANVILKKENGTWKVVLGPGTYFDDESLQAIGAPQNLKNEANKTLSKLAP